MGTSRRDFLKRGTVVALAAGVPITVAENVLGAERSPSSATAFLNKEQFMAQLNKKFVISEGKQQIATKLIDVADIKLPKNVSPRRGKEGFTLTFEGERGLRQNTYTIENTKLGKFSMFIVPVSIDNDTASVRYEAVINRLYP